MNAALNAVERFLGWPIVPLIAYALVSDTFIHAAGLGFWEWLLCLLIYVHYSTKLDVMHGKMTAATPANQAGEAQ